VYCCQYMVDRASMHGTYAYFPGPCKNARMQRQTSKAAAVLLALLVEDNELAHARSLLAIHDDMTKAHAVRSTRQVPLKSFHYGSGAQDDGSLRVASSSSVHCCHMASASATGQVSGVCAVITSESYEARRVSSVKPSQANVAPGLIGRLALCTCIEA